MRCGIERDFRWRGWGGKPCYEFCSNHQRLLAFRKEPAHSYLSVATEKTARGEKCIFSMKDTTACSQPREPSLPGQPEQRLLGTEHCCMCDGFLLLFLACLLDMSVGSPSKKNQR